MFTYNATHALNIAIKGFSYRKKRVLISPLEHNAVTRPVFHLQNTIGLEFDIMPYNPDGSINIEGKYIDAIAFTGHKGLLGSQGIGGFVIKEDFAKEIGVSFATVNRWETGKAKPNLKTMKLIDDYCKRNDIDFDISEQIDE